MTVRCLFVLRNALQLPLKNISTGYRLEKARLVLKLRQLSDNHMSGRAWSAEACVDSAISRLQHQELVGRGAARKGLGWKEPLKLWSKASLKERTWWSQRWQGSKKTSS